MFSCLRFFLVVTVLSCHAWSLGHAGADFVWNMGVQEIALNGKNMFHRILKRFFFWAHFFAISKMHKREPWTPSNHVWSRGMTESNKSTAHFRMHATVEYQLCCPSVCSVLAVWQRRWRQRWKKKEKKLGIEPTSRALQRQRRGRDGETFRLFPPPRFRSLTRILHAKRGGEKVFRNLE